MNALQLTSISYILLCFVVVFCSGLQVVENFTMMTFNIWVSGSNIENGTYKIANHIKWVNPDVVGLQEVNDTKFLNVLLKLLGEGWDGIATTHSYPDTAILTRHKILEDSFHQISRGLGVRINIKATNRTTHVWNLHLDYRSYGPYAAFNKLVTEEQQIMAGEMAGGQVPVMFISYDAIHNAKHIKMHLENKIDIKNLKMNSSMEEFYYFIMYDINNDGRIDGIEFIKALTHEHVVSMDKSNTVNNEEKLESLVTTAMATIDLDDDGYITFSEYMKAIRK